MLSLPFSTSVGDSRMELAVLGFSADTDSASCFDNLRV